MSKITYRQHTPTARQFNLLTDSVGWGSRDEKVVEKALANLQTRMTVAVMGCVVNGPGEAREADIGVCGGKGEGLIIRKGEILYKVPEAELLPKLIAEIEAMTGEKL